MKFNLLYCLIFLAISLPAQEIYRWVDENGVVKYSDNMPDNIKKENVTKVNVRQSSSFKSIKQIAKDTGQTISEQQQELEQISKKNCGVATQNLKILTSFDKITQLDEEGNDVTLSDEEKEQQVSLVKKQVEIFCTQ